MMTPSTRRLDQRARRLRLGGRRALGVGGEHEIAERVRGLLDADRQLGVERVLEVGNDDADRRARARLQRAGDRVRMIAGLGDGALDPLARRFGDERRAVDDVGDRRLRDAGAARDIDERRHDAPSSSASARLSPASERSVPSGPS